MRTLCCCLSLSMALSGIAQARTVYEVTGPQVVPSTSAPAATAASQQDSGDTVKKPLDCPCASTKPAPCPQSQSQPAPPAAHHHLSSGWRWVIIVGASIGMTLALAAEAGRS